MKAGKYLSADNVSGRSRFVSLALRAVVVFLAVTAAMEFVVRQVYTSPSISRPDPLLGRAWRPHAYYFQAQEGGSAIITNSLGLNDIDVPSTHGVMVLGDSYVEAMQLPRDLNAVSLFRARHPQIPILNAGRRGLDLLNFPTMLEYVGPRYRPDMIVAVVTHYTLAPLRTRNFRLTRNALGEVVDITHPPLWTGEGRISSLGYALASRSALVQYMLFKYQDRIKQLLGIGIGVAGAEQVDADSVGLASLTSPEFTDIAAYVFHALKAQAPLVVIFIPDMAYSSRHAAQMPEFSRQAEALFSAAAKREGVPFIGLAPEMAKAFASSGQEAHGYANGVPGEGHINRLGHELLRNALEQAILAKPDAR